MILNWKGDGVLVVTPIDVKAIEAVLADPNLSEKQKYEKEAALRTGPKQVMLIPGWNDIDDDIWFKCRDHLTDKIDAGKIEEMIKEEKDEATGEKRYVGMKPSDFKNRNAVNGPEVLVKIIRGCNSVATLTKWKEGEGREEIRSEIFKKIEEMNKPPAES
jgi:hypothetical protein